MNIIYRILWVLPMILGVTSCSDFLDQEPGAQISITEQLSTKEGVQMALAGTYTSLEGTLRAGNFAVYNDLQSGNLTFTPTPTGSNKGQISVPFQIENVYNFMDDPRSSNLEGFYDGAYDVINQTNLLLENASLLPDATAAEVFQIEAEALAIRGFMHFMLSQVYAQDKGNPGSDPGIVYVTESLKEDLDYPSRKSLAETYELVEMDLRAAMEKFQQTNALPGPGYSYFGLWNTKAILARVLLTSGKYEQAVAEAQEVLDGSGIDLIPATSYVADWEEFVLPVSEILLELSPSRDQDGELGGSLEGFYGYNSTAIYGDYVASSDLVQLYEAGDIRGTDMFITAELPTLVDGTLTEVPYYFTKKFQGEPGYPVIRLSEMYFILAEAHNNLGNTDQALSALNVIRERAGITPLTITEGLESEILLERRREFAFEGHYFFDLKRMKQGAVRNDCIATTCDLDYPSVYFVLPIPQKNINLNENLIQNEGY